VVESVIMLARFRHHQQEEQEEQQINHTSTKQSWTAPDARMEWEWLFNHGFLQSDYLSVWGAKSWCSQKDIRRSSDWRKR
jgi:hypothetical protein